MRPSSRSRAGVVLVVAVCSMGVSNAFSKPVEKPAPVDAGEYKAFMATQVSDLYDLEQFFVRHQDSFLPLVPPDPDFILRQPGAPPVLPFAWKGFPPEFVKGLSLEYENSVPVYPVTILEDPLSRETVFLNADGKAIYKLAPITGYDPFSYLKWLVPALYSGAYSSDEVYFWQKLYDPSRVHVSVKLLPVEYVEPYLYAAGKIREQQAALAAQSDEGDDGGMMLLWFPPTDTGIVFKAFAQQTNGLAVTVGYPSWFTNRLEIFACTDLMAFCWDLAATNLSTAGTNEITWIDTDAGQSSSQSVAYCYAIGNADVDADSDQLKDSHEFFLFHTSMADPDSDDDGALDGLDPQPTNGAVSRLYLSIASPADGAVLGGYE